MLSTGNTGSQEIGLHAKRSPLKVLNHADMSRDHDGIAYLLGVNHLSSQVALFEDNRLTLAGHSKSEIPTTRAIEQIAANGTARGRSMNSRSIRDLLLDYYKSAQVEFHPSDICNEKCMGCTYGHDDPRFKPAPICFPFDRLDELARFAPRAITIVGGGEPLLYKDRTTGARFPELMDELRRLMPNCRFGLITNGTIMPDGDWYRHFDWVRFSVDAGDAAAYSKMRGRDLFGAVVDNLLLLLRHSTVPQINVGYVFSRENIRLAATAAAMFYNLVKCELPEQLHRLHIEYRPLRRDSKDEDRDEFPGAITEKDIAVFESDMAGMSHGITGFADFLAMQTNWEIIKIGNRHEPMAFSSCGFSSIFRIVRANGEIRPCCMRLNEPEFYLGNILKDLPETIALNTLYNVHYLKPGCDGPGCKLGGVNSLIEEGIAGRARRSDNHAIADNPFFG